MTTTERALVVSARARDRLDAARDWLVGRDPAAPLVVLGAPAEAPLDLLHDVVHRTGAFFGWHRASLTGLAAELAGPELARRGLALASGLAVEAITVRVVARLSAAGALGRFSPVADRPGFSRALARTLAELREALADPSALRPELGAALTAYDAELTAWRLADRAALLGLATQAVHAPHRHVGVPLLLLDVPLSTAVEIGFVRALARRAPVVFATAPHGDAPGIAATEAALDTVAVRLPPTGDTSLARLQEHLFDPRAPEPATLAPGIELVSAPWESREAVEIVRRVLVHAERGVPFDQMAVLLRDPGTYRAHLEEAFRRAEVPAWFVRGSTAPDLAGRSLLALLSCAAEKLSARAFAEYLSLGELPRSPSDPNAPIVVAPRSWERLLVDASVIDGGPERWERRLRGLEAEAESQRAVEEPDSPHVGRLARRVGHVAALRAFALPILGRLHALPTAATWGVWLEALRELATAALHRPERVLEILDELSPMAEVGPVGLHEVRTVLDERLRELPRAPGESRYGKVLIGPTEAARGRSFVVVFVPGLVERGFPRRIVDDPLLPDAERSAIPGLPARDDRAAAERLALHLAVGAARERVVLSWPRADVAEGRPRVPSFYALEVLRAVEGHLPDFRELEHRCTRAGAGQAGWPAPEHRADAIDDAEHDLCLLRDVLHRSDEAVGAAHYLLTSNATLARSLRARGRRWIRRWSAADGLIDASPEARAALARRAGPQAAVSVTSIEQFAACPYRFFLRSVVRLAPVEAPRHLETLDARNRGALFHEVQFAVASELRDAGVDHLPGALRAMVDRHLDDVARTWSDRVAPAIERVWADAVEEVRADLHEWVLRLGADRSWRPVHAELGFGLRGAGPAAPGGADLDPASLPDPIDLGIGVRLRGAIDLVEVDPSGALRVTDHKTGAHRPAPDAITAGARWLQPVLYALAAERGLGRPVAAGRLWFCTHRGGYAEHTVPLDAPARTTAAEVARLFRARVDRAELPAAPRPDACAACDFRVVCGPHEEQRVGVKSPSEIADLHTLRSQP